MTHSQSELQEIADALREAKMIPEECTICHLPRAEHNTPNIVHEFCSPGQQKTLVARSQQSPDAHEGNQQGSNGLPATITSDAILRLALLRRGIITTDDLDEIEKELRVTGVAFHDPGRVSHS